MSEGFAGLVRRRFSVRIYQERPVEKEKIEACLEAARLAPSACNSQPWKFIVVDDDAVKKELCDNIFSGSYSMNAFAGKAPVIVAVVSEKSSFVASVGALLRDTRYYLIDIGIAAEHFALQAAELGLGTCWIGWFDEKSAKRVLKVPSSKRIDVVLALGYPDREPPETKRRMPLGKMSSYNSYESGAGE